jgi:lipoate-protein ligase A
VVAPRGALGGAREAYRRINEALASALARLGAPVEVVSARGPAAGAPRPDAGPCFRVPAAGEVTARGRKIVGSAQARIGGALLQHGSILLDGDQGPLAARGGSWSPITLRELVGAVSVDEVAQVVAERLGAGLGGDWTDGEVAPCERALADDLERERYAHDSWTWRR